MPPDADLDAMDAARLRDEVQRLRGAIRAHRDATSHGLCWHHPDLWGLLPEQLDPDIEVPAWPQFMRGCIRYRESLDEQTPDAPRVPVEYGENGGQS